MRETISSGKKIGSVKISAAHFEKFEEKIKWSERDIEKEGGRSENENTIKTNKWTSTNKQKKSCIVGVGAEMCMSETA